MDGARASPSRAARFLRTAARWLLVLLVGAAMGATAFLVNVSVENVGGVKFSVATALLQRGRFLLAFLSFSLADVLLVLSAALLCALLAPEAAGSGIPDVKAFLNGVVEVPAPKPGAGAGAGAGAEMGAGTRAGAGPAVVEAGRGAGAAGDGGSGPLAGGPSAIPPTAPASGTASGGSWGGEGPRVLAARTLLVLGSIATVSGGLSVGKEGPRVHSGACLAFLLSRATALLSHPASGCPPALRRLLPPADDREARDLVTCGAASGVAGAFRAPVGGVLFALEEATSWWRHSLLWRVFLCNAVVALVLRTLMSLCEGGACGPFSSGGFIIFDRRRFESRFGLLELLAACLLGVLGGLLGGLFNHLNVALCRRRKVWRTSVSAKVAEALAVAALTSVVRFFAPLLAGCVPCPRADAAGAGAAAAVVPPLLQTLLRHSACPSSTPFGPFKRFACPAGHYSDVAGLLFSTNEDAIRHLFNTIDPTTFRTSSLVLHFFSFYFLSIITYGIFVPSGLFVPAIVNGAVYGRLCGILTARLFPACLLGPGNISLLGAASFLGGSMRMTVSLCIILLELTGSLELLPLIMLVLLVSKSVGDLFNENVYDTHMRLKGAPFLAAPSRRLTEAMRAAEVGRCISAEPVTFAGIERVSRIIETLKLRPHNAFPVITQNDDGTTSFAGMVLKSHLLSLLKAKAFERDPESATGKGKGIVAHAPLLSFWESRALSVDDISPSEEEQSQFVDLLPFVNKATYLVPEDMSLTKVYSLFRHLGLRHLCVVKRPANVIGVITRKDFLPSFS